MVEENFCSVDKVVNASTSIFVIENINKKLMKRQKELFAKTCFGKFLQLQQLKFSSALTHRLLMKRLVCPGKEGYPLRFKIGKKECEFGLQEFALITGLDCREFYSVKG